MEGSLQAQIWRMNLSCIDKIPAMVVTVHPLAGTLA
jgi:hypothetical protein